MIFSVVTSLSVDVTEEPLKVMLSDKTKQKDNKRWRVTAKICSVSVNGAEDICSNNNYKFILRFTVSKRVELGSVCDFTALDNFVMSLTIAGLFPTWSQVWISTIYVSVRLCACLSVCLAVDLLMVCRNSGMSTAPSLSFPVTWRRTPWSTVTGCYSSLLTTRKMENSMAARFHDTFTQFKVYEDYLDSKVTPTDLFYLRVSCIN